MTKAKRFFFQRVIAGAVLFWGGLATVATLFDPAWPATAALWIDFVLAAYISTFLAGKTWQMWTRTTVWHRLGASIIAVNAGFVVAYTTILLFTLWPGLAESPWSRLGLRAEIAAAVTWSGIEVMAFASPFDDRRERLTWEMTAAALVVLAVLLWRVMEIPLWR